MFDFDKPLSDEYDGEIDWESIEELVEQFCDSPEGSTYKDTGTQYVPMVIEYALNYEIDRLADFTPRVMEIVLFGLFPEKVSTEPDSAKEIVEENLAFWQFLQRQYRLKHAPGIVALLTPKAVERLRRELADPSNFGMAKSFFMAGQEAGYDMTTQQGLDAFMLKYNERLAGQPRRPPLGPPMGGFRILPPGAMPGDVYEDDFDDDEDDNEGERLVGPSPTTGLSPKERAEQRKQKRKADKAKKRKRK